MKEKWLIIYFKNGDIRHYSPSEYTDYYYDGKCFVVIKYKQWVGMYNLDVLSFMEIRTKEEAERTVTF